MARPDLTTGRCRARRFGDHRLAHRAAQGRSAATDQRGHDFALGQQAREQARGIFDDECADRGTVHGADGDRQRRLSADGDDFATFALKDISNDHFSFSLNVNQIDMTIIALSPPTKPTTASATNAETVPSSGIRPELGV